MRPGVEISVKDAATPAGARAQTGTWFATGITDKGDTTTAIRVTSLGAFVTACGNRRSDSVLYDGIETYFRQGGAVAYIGRVVGPAAATAQVTIGTGITIKAASPGEWGNSLKAQIVAGDAGGEYKIVVLENDVEVERSPSLVDNAAATNWAVTSSSYIRVTSAGASDPPVTAATALTGGVSDVLSATDTHWANALNLFTRALGPGQVSHPGRTTTAAHTQLLAHADANNRVAILDGPDTAVAATLTAASAALRALTGRRSGGLFAPWATISGLTPGTTRTIPYSAVQAALEARVDESDGPHRPAAGVAGIADTILGLTQTYTDADRATLNEGGVNVARMLDGQARTYGHRSVTNPVTDPSWTDLHAARQVMAIRAEAEAIAERKLFRPIDGQGYLFAELRGELTAMLRRHYDAGGLYGQTPAEAFRVDTGAGVNTPTTIAAGKIRAAIALRVSPMGELVQIDIVKTRTEESI